MAAHALDDMTVFREYEPRECKDGRYPFAWDVLGDGHDDLLDAADMVLPGSMVGVKDIVRQVAGHRCQRCGHPYYVGKGLGVWEAADKPSDDPIHPALFDELEVHERRRITSGMRHWSPCDIRCAHFGPYRWRLGEGYPWTYVEQGDEPGRIIADGIAKGAEIQAAWRILTVHHLNERKHDLRWWNLAALCQRCHLTIQRKVTMEDSWPWEHTDWFKPHAAAWYALRYLGEHLTYTATIARLDELLALGREQESVERMAL